MLKIVPIIALLYFITSTCGISAQRLYNNNDRSKYNNRDNRGHNSRPGNNPIQYGEQNDLNIDPRKSAKTRTAKSEYVQKYMNLEADPCKDFYEFACGNWGAEYKMEPPDSEESEEEEKNYEKVETITVQSQLEQEIVMQLDQILLAGPVRQVSGSEKRLKSFYESCRAEKSTSQAQNNFFINFAKNNFGLPEVKATQWQSNYRWELVIARLRLLYGIEILVGLDLDENVQMLQGKSIYLKEPETTLIPPEFCNAAATVDRPVQDEVYENITQEVSANMKAWFNKGEEDATRFAAEIVRLEFELCKAMRKEEELPIPTEQTRRKRQSKFGSHQRPNTRNRQTDHYAAQNGILSYNWEELSRKFNGINFKKFIDEALNTTINSRVYMRSEFYFRTLASVISKSSIPTLANYIMYRALSTLAFPLDNEKQTRIKFCIEMMKSYYPSFVGEMYRMRMFREESFSDIKILYDIILNAFQNYDPTWMEHGANQKLSGLKLSFPIYMNLDYNELPREELNYWNKLVTAMQSRGMAMKEKFFSAEPYAEGQGVEAYDVDAKQHGSRDGKEIVIGFGLLMPPFYDYYYPRSLKFSLIGHRIARELVAVTLDQSESSKWSDYTKYNFQNRSECFRTQYSNYIYDNPNMFYNSTRLTQVMADSSGLNITFNAYLDWLEGMRPDKDRNVLSKETLTDINFTNTQLFFINFAQTRCMVRTNEPPPPDYLPLYKHTPERYDVNGPLSNSMEFAREFNCAAGTIMNPDDKCNLD